MNKTYLLAYIRNIKIGPLVLYLLGSSHTAAVMMLYFPRVFSPLLVPKRSAPLKR